MFPTQHHTALVEFAFKAGGSSYWKSAGSGGLSAAEVSAIDYGSRLTDTLFGTGQLFNLTPPHVDPPITAIVSEAPKHAMTPGDMSVDVARAQAYKWISENTGLAREKQRASCMKNYEAVRLNNEKSKHIAEQHRMANNGRPIPSPPAAIKSEKDRNDVYDFLKRTGQSWNEDIIPKQENISAAIGSLMPPRFGYGFTYLG